MPFLVGLALTVVLALPSPADAACEVCKRSSGFLGNTSCYPALENEVGVTRCVMHTDSNAWPPAVWCTEEGTFCSVTNATGGGASGGGGGSCVITVGSGCPAECSSCTGGGGRPRI